MEQNYIPYSGLFFEAFIFRESTANPRKLKSWKIINVEEARFSISIREITFREQELNWLFAKYKRLENESTAGADASVETLKL